MLTRFFFLCLIACFSGAHAWSAFNSTTDTHKVVCIYPISGSYSLLQRLNYYTLLLFVICYSHKKLLVQGATAAVMIFAGVTAVHAFALACSTTRNRAAFDMDIFGTWAVLGITSLFLSPFLQWSAVLRKSEARPLVQLWGVLVACGTICATVNVWRAYDVSYPCVNIGTNITATSITSTPPGVDQHLNCTPTCFTSHQIFRNPSELLVANMSRVFDDSYGRSAIWPGILVTVAGVVGLFSSLSEDSEKTPLQVKQEKSFRTFQHRAHASNRRRGLPANWPVDPMRARRLYPRQQAPAELFMAIFAYGSPIIFIVAVTCNEIYLLHSPRLPLGESPYSVGQWGCWVATILVLMSTLLDTTSAPATTGDTSAGLGGVPVVSSVTAPAAMSGGVALPQQASDAQEDDKIEGEGKTSQRSDDQSSQSVAHDSKEEKADIADAYEEEPKNQKVARKTTMQILEEDHEKMQRAL